ncbi:hypothetical protein HX884_03915 [Enterobacter sp. SECR19-1250]|uniref:hypothetical protein n=1 Tax=Enterobacter sp. SECR19-1250 TaxID=2749084 RepID=UPI0015B445B6|nr:hypothetical protein [Enterobacter sp. SECR19-1250]NWJ78789.1 hypothetical protein [Enterobacter sp. SECR19-1250]
MSIFYISIAVAAVFFAIVQRSHVLEIRKEMKQYADRMEAAELDLHAIRSVVTNRLHNTGAELKNNLQKPDPCFLETLADDLIEVQRIVETRGPSIIGGRPYWQIEPQENPYQYGEKYPMFPD